MTGITLPDFTGARRVFAAFERAGIVAAVGGSAVLAARGLIDAVRDWDITTDAELDAVRAALDADGITFTVVPKPDSSYLSRAILRVDDAPVEIFVGYMIGTPAGAVPIPTIVESVWHGLPLSAPEPWVLAYRAMGRTERSDALQGAIDTGTGEPSS